MLLIVSSPAPTGSQVAGSGHACGLLFSGLTPSLSTSSWHMHCCCYYFFQNLLLVITHHETPTHLFATVMSCCRTTLAALQIKPRGKSKNMRKGSLILFQFKINLFSWFFTRYGNLVTLQDKHK